MVRPVGASTAPQACSCSFPAAIPPRSGYPHARVKTKLTALIVACGSLALGAIAQGATVPVAVYTFETKGDVAAFQKAIGGSKCTKKWRQMKQMAITVGPGTTACPFRTSVVGDSTDPGSDMEVSAAASLAANTSAKLLKKAFVGVAARSSETSGYELRVRPAARVWQLFRDPRGAPGPVLHQAGKAAIKGGAKPTKISLQAFDNGTTTTTVTAFVNGKAVLTLSDALPDQPDGRRSVVSTGVKGSGSGSGVIGIFDNVAIRVPSPF